MADHGLRPQRRTLTRMLPEHRHCRPGFRGNLPPVVFTKHSRLKVPRSLNSQRWVFVREGLGDSRKGCPPRHSLIIQGPKEGFLPPIHHRALLPTPRKRQNELPKATALLSKHSPAQQARKAFLEDVEAGLARHPLALHPHLAEALPAELLLHVLEVLDPERELEDTWASCQDARKRMKEPTKLSEKCPPQMCPPKKIPVSHSRQWLYEEKPNEVDLLCKDSLVHENVHRGVRDFCHWATASGSSKIDEEFILQEFDIDYQTRHSCDVLRVMRLNQVPWELKKSVGLDKLQEAEWTQKLEHKRRLREQQNPYKPKRVKMRYGAWYLNTNLWKNQRVDEPLMDPKLSYKAPDEGFKKQLQEQDELLAELHGTLAFKNFVLSKGYRMPRFLEKMYAKKKGKSGYSKTPPNLTQA